MAKEERGEIDVLPSYLLFYGDRTMLLDHIRRNEISRDRKGVTVALTQFQRNFEQGIYIYIENIATSSLRSFHLDGGEKSLSLGG